MLVGKVAAGGPNRLKGKIEAAYLDEVARESWFEIRLEDEDANSQLEQASERLKLQRKALEKRLDEKKAKITAGDDLAPGVLKMVKVYLAVKRRVQPGDKMAGRHGNKGVISHDRSGRRHAVSGRRNAGRHRAESAGRAFAHERRSGARDPSRLGGQGPRTQDRQDDRGAGRGRRSAQVPRPDLQPGPAARRKTSIPSTTPKSIALAKNLSKGVPIATPVFDGASEAEIKRLLDAGGPAAVRPDAPVRRPHRREIRTPGHGRLHVHAEAQPPGRRQDARAFDRSVLARHAAAAGWQGAVRRPALRRNGSLGARGLRRFVHAAGNADRQVGRRERPHARCTRTSSTAITRWTRACPNPSTCSSKRYVRSASTSNWNRTKELTT